MVVVAKTVGFERMLVRWSSGRIEYEGTNKVVIVGPKFPKRSITQLAGQSSLAEHDSENRTIKYKSCHVPVRISNMTSITFVCARNSVSENKDQPSIITQGKTKLHTCTEQQFFGIKFQKFINIMNFWNLCRSCFIDVAEQCPPSSVPVERECVVYWYS